MTGIFYDAMVELIGQPQNFSGEVIIFSLAAAAAIAVGGCGFIILATLLFRRRK